MMFSPYFLIIATAYLFIFVYFLLSNYKIIQAVCGEKNAENMRRRKEEKYHIVPILKEAYVREGNSNPLQYSCLGNPIDRGARRATIHGVTKEWDKLLMTKQQLPPIDCLAQISFVSLLGEETPENKYLGNSVFTSVSNSFLFFVFCFLFSFFILLFVLGSGPVCLKPDDSIKKQNTDLDNTVKARMVE